MAIPRPLICLWLVLAAALAALLLWQQQRERARYAPVPQHPQTISVQTDLAAFTWQRTDDRWHMNGKALDTARIQDWLAQLRRCYGAYNPADIAPSDNPQPVTLTIDGQTYHLGAANPFANAHYLNHGDKIYLCDQSVKAALRLAPEHWLENPDA